MERSFLKTWLMVAFPLIVVWAFTPWLTGQFIHKSETRGQFGDLFGSVNALFSGLAFAGLIVAINLQRQDLALQREELRLTREELARTADAQVKAEAALKRTIHANAFGAVFEMLQSQEFRLAEEQIGRVVRSGMPLRVPEMRDDVMIWERLCITWDAIGYMTTKDIVPREYVVECFGPAISTAWKGTEAFVNDRRMQERAALWKHFEDLATAVRTSHRP